jgi:hypothetical protein
MLTALAEKRFIPNDSKKWSTQTNWKCTEKKRKLIIEPNMIDAINIKGRVETPSGLLY